MCDRYEIAAFIPHMYLRVELYNLILELVKIWWEGVEKREVPNSKFQVPGLDLLLRSAFWVLHSAFKEGGPEPN